MRKIWHVYAGTLGTGGAYIDALLLASHEANIAACAFVSRHYSYDTPGVIKYFFPLTDLTRKRNLLINVVRALELVIGYALIYVAAVVMRPVLNLHLADPFFCVRALCHASKFIGLRVYVTCHDVAAGNVRMTDQRRRVFLAADKLVVHSSTARGLLLEQVGDRVPDRIVQYNFPFSSYDSILSPEKTAQAADVLKSLLGDEHVEYFLLVGVVRQCKGVETLLDAWRMSACKRTRKLLIAGRWWGMPDAIESKARQLDNCIVLNRRLSDEEFAHFIARAKFSVLPYLSYSHSSVLISCAKSGGTVIVSDIGLFAEFLPDYDLTFASRSSSELAAVLDRAAEMSKDDVEVRGDLLRQAVARYDRDLVKGIADAYA